MRQRPARLIITNKRQAAAYLGTVQRLYNLDRAYPCLEGHFDCASREDGPCSDAVAATYRIGHYREEHR